MNPSESDYSESIVAHHYLNRYDQLVPDHKRPQRTRDPKNVVVMLMPGLWAELTPYEVDVVIDGVAVHAVLDWDRDTKAPFIESLEIDRGTGTIDPSVLRSITVPGLVSAGGTSARFWVNDECTEPFSEERYEDESLEAWAARLFYVCTVTKRSPAAYIAEVQGITPGSAAQRLTTARKMGLLDLGPKARQRARTARKQQGRAH